MNDNEDKFTRDMVDGIRELFKENKESITLSCPICSGKAILSKIKGDMNHLICICGECGKILSEGRLF